MNEHLKVASTHPGQLDLSHFILTREQFNESFSDTYDRDLLPYADDTFLIQRLNENNRTLRRNPHLKEEIEIALISDDDEAILEVVDDIAQAWQHSSPEPKKPISTIFSYLTLMKSMNDYKVMLLGRDAPTTRINALMGLIAHRIASTIPEAQLTDALNSAQYVEQRLDGLFQRTGDKAYPYYKIKMGNIKSEIQRRDMATRYIDALPGGDQMPITQEEARSDSSHISELFAQMQSTRQYGVKMGYIPDERGGSLVFNPPHNPRDSFRGDFANVHSLMTNSPTEAEIIHSRIKHPTRLKPRVIEVEYAGNNDLRSGSLSFKSLDPLTLLELGPDGELYVDRQCTIPYSEIARTRGKYQVYRDLQATILAHYFDLTHATTISHVASGQNLYPAVRGQNRSPLESIERLVVPRIRLAQPLGGSEQGTVETEDQSERSVRYHEIGWFRRPLPPGWYASPAAHELAKKHGITLQPGETIVRAHSRGSKALGEVAGHQLVTLKGEVPTEP